MERNKIAKIVMFFLVLAVLVNTADAIGMSPAQKYIDYNPGSSETNMIRIFNEEGEEAEIMLHVEGDIAEYIELETNLVEFEEGQDKAEIRYKVNMPDEIEKGGIHEGRITAFRIPEKSKGGEVGVEAVVSVSSIVKLRVPFPDEYVEANLYVENAEPGESVGFLIPIFSYGREDVDVHAKIEIYGATYEKIGEVHTDTLNLKKGEEGQLAAGWKADVNQGSYKAVVTVYYSDQTIKMEKIFDVGSKYIDILGIEVEDFALGSIAQFDIMIENLWGQEIKDVYADVIFKDQEGTEYGRFKTSEEDIGGGETLTLEAYWNTQGIEIGEYYLDITLNYAGKTSKSLIETFVNLDSITTNKVVGEVIKSGGEANRINILILGMVILVLINIGWFIYFKKIRKR